MWIEKIFIRNFRPIGDKGLELVFAPRCTVIVGENNVGKSSILEALKKVYVEHNAAWDAEEWHAGDQSKTIEIILECALNDSQIKQIIEILDISYSITEFKEFFANKLMCVIKKSVNESSLIFKLGEVYIESNTGWIGEIDRKKGYGHVDWISITEKIRLQKTKKPYQAIKEALDKYKEDKPNAEQLKIIFNRPISVDILKVLKQSIVVIEEFRERPHKALSDFLISTSGKELASVLFNLKNARSSEQRKKFEHIQEKFSKLFPTLKLDVIRERESNEIKILTQKIGIESTTFYLGAGVVESLLLLTHLIAHSDKILCVDHPELHLHPHAQRRLGSFIEEAKGDQILIITHSPYFINLNKNNSVRRAIQKNGQLKIIGPSQNYFTDGDFFKSEQFLDIDAKELFFSRKVILVEGSTELGALPIFAAGIGYNLDESGVSVINVGGKGNFEFFVKLCEGFQIPHFVIADKDAESTLAKIKERHPDCKSYVLPATFDDLLPMDLREEATKFVGESKPRIGRYVARKMLEENNGVPEDIKKIIDEIKELEGG